MGLDDNDLARVGDVVKLNVLEAMQLHVSQEHAPLWRAVDDSRDRISYIEGRTNANPSSSDAAKSGGPKVNSRMIHISGSPKQFGILIAIILALGAVFFGLNERGRAADVKAAVEQTDASWLSQFFF